MQLRLSRNSPREVSQGQPSPRAWALMHAAWVTNIRSCSLPPGTWWHEQQDWSAAMDGYLLFRRHRWRRGGGVPLDIREALNTMEREITEDNVMYPCVRIMGKADILVGVC